MTSEVNVYLENIYTFLEKELSLLEEELTSQLLSISNSKIDLHNIIKYFFEMPGKKLRPILVLLSAGIIPAEGRLVNQEDKTMELSVAIELIHSSSLIHDDIVDESQERRGQTTLNRKFNNKIAVLCGDLLYSHAFLIINKLQSNKILNSFTKCIEIMCKSELSEIISPFKNLQEYISYIEAKTAKLMSVSCECGAITAKADDASILAVSKFGLNFGIAYQLIDDFLDDECPQKFNIDLIAQAQKYAKKAIDSLFFFEESTYKKFLINLVKYVLEKINLKKT